MVASPHTGPDGGTLTRPCTPSASSRISMREPCRSAKEPSSETSCATSSTARHREYSHVCTFTRVALYRHLPSSCVWQSIDLFEQRTACAYRSCCTCSCRCRCRCRRVDVAGAGVVHLLCRMKLKSRLTKGAIHARHSPSHEGRTARDSFSSTGCKLPFTSRPISCSVLGCAPPASPIVACPALLPPISPRYHSRRSPVLTRTTLSLLVCVCCWCWVRLNVACPCPGGCRRSSRLGRSTSSGVPSGQWERSTSPSTGRHRSGSATLRRYATFKRKICIVADLSTVNTCCGKILVRGKS